VGLAAMTQSEITIKNVQWDSLGQLPTVFKKLGITIEKRGDDLFVPEHKNGYEIQSFIDGSILTISDAPWPGFTPDLLSIVLVVATQARGSVLIHQKMFESRLFFVDKLIDMGAKIILCDPHRATVIGNDFESPLKAATLTSPDIRAGVSLLIAALSANGKSTIHNIEQIDRGYENIDTRLKQLGAKIERVAT
jgi:UDP-N-acetylglucosamine 1-carboxyvinyltransferase